MTSVADHLIARLRDAGVRTLFGVPGGGGNLDLIAAAAWGGLPFVLTSTETGGAIAAIAQAEITGTPGACLTTLGPGAASVVNGVACASLERAPLVVFTDSYATADLERFEHQRLDHAALFAGITKFSGRLEPESAFEVIEQAFRVLSARPAGPVHLDCPANFESARRETPAFGTDAVDVTDRTTVWTSPDSGTSVEDLLKQSRKPLAIVGLGARRPAQTNAIRTLCDRHCLPAMVTYKAKGVVPDTHPWFAGVFTNGTLEKPLCDESDLLIGLGLDEVELLPRPWQAVRSIRYSPDPESTADAMSQVDETLRRTEWDAAHVRAGVEAQRRKIAISTAGMSAQCVVERAARLAGDCRVTVDAGAHMFPATLLWPVDEPNRLLISNGLSTMGFALPAAIGAALLDREQPVVALTGDGGLLMCLGELVTAVRERLKIVLIVFSDASLSLIETKQQARRLAPAGVALGAMDWPSVARGCGAGGLAATNASELDRAIGTAFATSGPTLIEAKIDRSNYGAMLKAIRG